MADAVATQTILIKDAVLKFTNVSDGTGESAVTKVDGAEGDGGRACTDATRKIWWQCTGMKVIFF